MVTMYVTATQLGSYSKMTKAFILIKDCDLGESLRKISAVVMTGWTRNHLLSLESSNQGRQMGVIRTFGSALASHTWHVPCVADKHIKFTMAIYDQILLGIISVLVKAFVADRATKPAYLWGEISCLIYADLL